MVIAKVTRVRIYVGMLSVFFVGSVFGCSGESNSGPQQPQPSGKVNHSTLQPPNGSTADPFEAGAHFEVVPGDGVGGTETVGSAAIPSGLNSFDMAESEKRATATIPGLGDVELRPDGQVGITPTPVYEPETGKDISDQWNYRTRPSSITTGEGRVEDFGQPAEAEFDGNEIKYHYGTSFSVFYENRIDGLKQSVRIGPEYGGTPNLDLHWEIPDSFDLTEMEDGTVSVALNGETRFVWSGLVVMDANGAPVEAQMEVSDGQLVYAMSTEDASFPLHIDPLAQSAQHRNSGSQSASLYGFEVESAGDVNNDGYSDLLVGQIGWNDGGKTSVGRALLYLGSSSGIESTAKWTSKGSTVSEFYGIGAGIGDIDGDGNDDVAVGGYHYTSGSKKIGRVRLYLGGASQTGLDSTAAETVTGSQDKQAFGRAVAGGDFDCDGTPDVAVGSPNYDGGAGTNAGRVQIFYGSSSSPYLPNSASWTFNPSKGGGFVGWNMMNAGDVDNDGCDDLVVGGYKYPDSNGNTSGAAMVFLGQSGGPNASPDWTKVGPDNSQFGRRVSPAGDVNGDGNDDVAVGAPGDSSKNGLVHVYYGNSSGLKSNPDWTKNGSGGGWFGIGLGSGDVNGDGTSDLVVGARRERKTSGGGRLGAVHLFLTNPGGTRQLSSQPNWTAYGNDPDTFFGYSVTVLPDANSTPADEADIVVGASLHKSKSGTAGVGSIFGYYGKATCHIGGTYYADGASNPNNPCEVCNNSSSATSWSNASMGTTCDDGDACTVNTTCDGSGNCTGAQKMCDDNNPCTKNKCDSQQGCHFPNESQGTSCPSDGKSCTSDQCDGSGACVHTVTTGCLINGSCVAAGSAKKQKPCQQCVPSKSRTQYSPVGAGPSCDDGKECTTNDQCDGSGTCSGTQRDCTKTLDPEVVSCNNSFSCDDLLNKCRVSNPKSNGTMCNDQNACTSGTTCQNGVCTAMTTVSCSNPCKTCDPSTGNCTMNKPDGTSCNTDMDVCSLETCQSGSCMMTGNTKDCDDGNPCTTDSCSASGGCMNQQKSQGAACGDPMCNSSNNLVQAPTCDASGQCQMAQVKDCGDYKCQDPMGSMASCPDVCTQDNECKDGAYCIDLPTDSDGDKECSDNRPPTADAGMDQGGFSKGQTASLDGSQSSDPDMGDTLSYKWELVDASCPDPMQQGQADLQRLKNYLADTQKSGWDPTAKNPSFTVPAADCNEEELTFELTVNDGEFDSDPDQTKVSYGDCSDKPNAVVAGMPASAEWGETVTLDASKSTTGCGDELSYSWSHSPQMPAITTNAVQEGEQLEVILPDICRDSDMNFQFDLTVHDGVKNSDPYTKPLLVKANGPCEGDEIAEPGPDQDTGPTGDLGPMDAGVDASQVGDVSGSSCGCGASGDNHTPPLPISLLAAVFVGGAIRLRRRR